MQKCWVVTSIYRKQDESDPRNWLTAVFSNEEAANRMKNDIEEKRKDIEFVYAQEIYVCESVYDAGCQKILKHVREEETLFGGIK